MNHAANRSTAAWKQHVPKHGINAAHAEAIIQSNKIRYPITPITITTMIVEYNSTVPNRLATQLIIPIMIHNTQTTNPAHGIVAMHIAHPSRHPDPNITIGIVSRGTIMVVIKQSKVIKRVDKRAAAATKMQTADSTTNRSIMRTKVAMMHITPTHKAHMPLNTNPATHSRAQSPHPTTIAKMIMMASMRTIMLSMKRISGTITKPNQPIKKRSRKPKIIVIA